MANQDSTRQRSLELNGILAPNSDGTRRLSASDAWFARVSEAKHALALLVVAITVATFGLMALAFLFGAPTKCGPPNVETTCSSLSILAVPMHVGAAGFALIVALTMGRHRYRNQIRPLLFAATAARVPRNSLTRAVVSTLVILYAVLAGALFSLSAF